MRTSYHARVELTTIEGTTTLSQNLLRLPVAVEEPRENAVDAAEAAKASRRGTKRLRELNLFDEALCEADMNFLEPHAREVWRAGWELEQARHQIVGRMYALMDYLGENLELAGYPEEGQTVLQTLHPFLVADAQLAPILLDVRDGGSDLYGLDSIRQRMQHRASHAE